MKEAVFALLLALFALGCGGTPDGERLVIFHAGSLSVPFREICKEFEKIYPNIMVEREASGSRVAVRKVTELGRQADLVAVSDYTVIEDLMFPEAASWYILFARGEMVLAINKRCGLLKRINKDNWYDVLIDEDIIFTHSDPNVDPCGYRARLLWKLAEIYYGRPGLFNRLSERCATTYIRPKETDLIALLETGAIDCAFIYMSVALQHGLEFLELADEVNLSSPALSKFYEKACIELQGRAPGEIITKRATPIAYAITIPSGIKPKKSTILFIEFLLGWQGQEIMKKSGHPPIVPPVVKNVNSLPQRLREILG